MKPYLKQIIQLLFIITVFTQIISANIQTKQNRQEKNLYGKTETELSKSKNLFTILNWNILYAFNHGRKTKEGIEWIKEQNANVVALQELNGQTNESFRELAVGWNHNYSVLLKESGFPVGISSDKPIEVINKKVEGFHHGYLHVKTYGIHFIVIHLWPGKENESNIISNAAKSLIDAGERVVVLGDFNAESSLDSVYLNTKPKLKGRINYSVLNYYLNAGLIDIVNKHDKNALVSDPSPIVVPKWHPDLELVKAIERRIDFIMASKNIVAKSKYATILRSNKLDKISDHYPIVAKFNYDFVKVQSSWFSYALEYKGIVVQDDAWNIWGCSPIMDDEGKVHLFMARWPEKTGHQGWKTHSEIVHYVADKPEGSYKFSEVVLQGSGESTWDKFAPHNPTIHKVGNLYALFYIANSGSKEHPSNQQIGLLLSESLYGPWKKAGNEGLVLSPPDDRSYYNYKAGNGVVNPALLQKDGKFYLYFKSNDTRKDHKWRPKMGLAIADNIEGPYRQMKDPITKNEQVIEDGYAFEYNNKVYLVTTDNHGMIEFGGGLIWESEDGLNFGEPKQAFTVLKKYLGGDIPAAAFRTKGEAGDKFERPQILMIDGKPAYIYMPSGTNISGGKGSAGYVLKIAL